VAPHHSHIIHLIKGFSGIQSIPSEIRIIQMQQASTKSVAKLKVLQKQQALTCIFTLSKLQPGLLIVAADFAIFFLLSSELLPSPANGPWLQT
jgi:hypothetical protein